MLHNDSLPIKCWRVYISLPGMMLGRSSVYLINISLKKSLAIETVVTLRGRYVAHQQEDDCSDPFGQWHWMPVLNVIPITNGEAEDKDKLRDVSFTSPVLLKFGEGWGGQRWVGIELWGQRGTGGVEPHSHHLRSPGRSSDSYRRLHFEGVDQN